MKGALESTVKRYFAQKLTAKRDQRGVYPPLHLASHNSADLDLHIVIISTQFVTVHR